MSVRLHPHARQRIPERGTTENEVVEMVEEGESFPAKLGRTGFRRNMKLTYDPKHNIGYYPGGEIGDTL